MAIRTKPIHGPFSRTYLTRKSKKSTAEPAPRKHVFEMTESEYADFCRKRNIQSLKECLPLFSWFAIVIILYVVANIYHF